MVDCEYGHGTRYACDLVATVFYFSKRGLKFWVCTEHYDEMARHYKKMSQNHSEDEWSREMVKLNGW